MQKDSNEAVACSLLAHLEGGGTVLVIGVGGGGTVLVIGVEGGGTVLVIGVGHRRIQTGTCEVPMSGNPMLNLIPTHLIDDYIRMISCDI